jgi:hypothetical protein
MNIRRLQRFNQVRILNKYSTITTIKSGPNIEYKRIFYASLFPFSFLVIGCSFIAFFSSFGALLQIRDMLVRIRPLTNGSGFGSGLFFFLLYFLKLHLHHFSKIKSQRSHETAGIKVFLTIFA